MKKIIAALDGLKYSESTVEYAVQIARETNSHLVGVFLDDFTHHSYSVYDMVPRLEPWTTDIKELNHHDQVLRNQAVDNFKQLCQQSDTHFTIHHDRNFALPELLHETIYADLLIIARNETLALGTQQIPTRFMQDLLGDIQCPAMVVPEEFDTIEKIVMLYDGQPSSLFAIKMFSYLLPFLKELPVEILSVKSSDQNLHIPDNRLMKEFVKRHFQTAAYQVLHGDPHQEIAEYLKQTDQTPLVVLGAYQRNMVSRWFRKSMADMLMEESKMPLFIAHK